MRQWMIYPILFLVMFGVSAAQANMDFDAFFVDKTMRIDYFHVGDAKEEFVTVDQVYEQGIWAGSLHNLIDNFNNGLYYAKIYDAASGKLIFSRGFNSYFGEYKTTGMAAEGRKRTFHETALVPYPKKKIRFTLEVRDRENRLIPFFSQEIDPSSVSIIRERPSEGVKVFTMEERGDPHNKVDIAFIGEGYTLKEQEKFKADLKKFTEIFFSHEPFKTYRERFNVYGVWKPSQESGCDEPRHGVFKNTSCSATFNALGLERYLLTEDNKALRDIAAHTPYDALLIMVNHKRYGGGGIYNLFLTFTTDNQWHAYLLLHEFGHSFAGLADEYYTSSTAYNEFYPRGVEPVEPNITSLLEPDELKWKDFVSPGIDIPTPWEKEDYDKADRVYQKKRQEINRKIAEMKKTGAPQEEIKKLEEEGEWLSLVAAKQADAYLKQCRSYGKVGAFEGAGYSSEGLYRPMLDCLMFTKGAKPFCEVCKHAAIRVIEHYSE
jgi:hypothetical protein